MEESVILSREMETCQDLLSGSGEVRNAAARTCFGVGRRSVSDDANHNYAGNDNGNNTASSPLPVVWIIWVRDAVVVLVCHGN